MNDNQSGATLVGTSLVTSMGSWFLHNIQVINGVMQFFVLLLSLIAGIWGVRKIMR